MGKDKLAKQNVLERFATNHLPEDQHEDFIQRVTHQFVTFIPNDMVYGTLLRCIPQDRFLLSILLNEYQDHPDHELPKTPSAIMACFMCQTWQGSDAQRAAIYPFMGELALKLLGGKRISIAADHPDYQACVRSGWLYYEEDKLAFTHDWLCHYVAAWQLNQRGKSKVSHPLTRMMLVGISPHAERIIKEQRLPYHAAHLISMTEAASPAIVAHTLEALQDHHTWWRKVADWRTKTLLSFYDISSLIVVCTIIITACVVIYLMIRFALGAWYWMILMLLLSLPLLLILFFISLGATNVFMEMFESHKHRATQMNRKRRDHLKKAKEQARYLMARTVPQAFYDRPDGDNTSLQSNYQAATLAYLVDKGYGLTNDFAVNGLLGIFKAYPTEVIQQTLLHTLQIPEATESPSHLDEVRIGQGFDEARSRLMTQHYQNSSACFRVGVIGVLGKYQDEADIHTAIQDHLWHDPDARVRQTAFQQAKAHLTQDDIYQLVIQNRNEQLETLAARYFVEQQTEDERICALNDPLESVRLQAAKKLVKLNQHRERILSDDKRQLCLNALSQALDRDDPLIWRAASRIILLYGWSAHFDQQRPNWFDKVYDDEDLHLIAIPVAGKIRSADWGIQALLSQREHIIERSYQEAEDDPHPMIPSSMYHVGIYAPFCQSAAQAFGEWRDKRALPALFEDAYSGYSVGYAISLEHTAQKALVKYGEALLPDLEEMAQPQQPEENRVSFSHARRKTPRQKLAHDIIPKILDSLTPQVLAHYLVHDDNLPLSTHYALPAMKRKGLAGIPHLIDHYRQLPAKERAACFQHIADHQQHAELIPFFISLLDDDHISADIRRTVITGIGQHGDPQYIPLLTRQLTHLPEGSFPEVIFQLEHLGWEAQGQREQFLQFVAAEDWETVAKMAETLFETLLDLLDCGSEALLVPVLRLLGEIGNPDAIAPIDGLICAQNGYSAVQAAGLDALGEIGGDHAISTLRSYLSPDSAWHNRRYNRSQVRAALKRIGTSVAETILEEDAEAYQQHQNKSWGKWRDRRNLRYG